jgi:hypothetical protein
LLGKLAVQTFESSFSLLKFVRPLGILGLPKPFKLVIVLLNPLRFKSVGLVLSAMAPLSRGKEKDGPNPETYQT